MNTTSESTAAVVTETVAKPIVLGRFQGAFAPFQISCFNDLRVAGFEPEISHKVAFDYGSDIGNAIRNAKDDALMSKVGKAKKDGESRISLSGGGATKTSPAMSLYRACQQTEALWKENLLKSRKLSREQLSERLNDYLTACDEWVTAHEFVK